MSIVTDILLTQFQVSGLSGYRQALNGGARALGGLNQASLPLNTNILATSAVAGAAAIGLGTLLVRAALDAGEEMAVFNRTSNNFKGAFPVSEVQSFTGGLQQLTGVADDNIASFLGVLGTFQMTKDQAESLALPILNATESLKALGFSSDQLANAVGKAAEQGALGRLLRMGIIFDQNTTKAFKTMTMAQRVKTIADALNRQGGPHAAELFRQTLPGSLQALQSELKDVHENIGMALVNPLHGAIEAVVGLAHAFNTLPKPIQGAVGGVGAIGTGLLAATSILGFLSPSVTQGFKVLRMLPPLFGSGLRAISGGVFGRATAGSLLTGAKFAGGALAVDLAAQLLPDTGAAGHWKRVLEGASLGFALGGGVGSLFGPGPGTAIGAGIGGLIGGGLAAYGEFGPGAGAAKPQTQAEQQIDLLQKQLDVANAQLATLQALKQGQAFPGSEVPGALQLVALRGMY